MESLRAAMRRKKMTKQLTGKRDDTALHGAARVGQLAAVRETLSDAPPEELRALLSKQNQDGSLALIARSNGKTALHSAARNGYVEVVRALVEAEPSIALRVDKKGQTALHMAAKGTSLDLFAADPTLLNLPDTKGNTALHIASRKARHQIITRMLELPDTNLKAINRSGETPLDTAEKMGNGEVAGVLAEHGVVGRTERQDMG